MFPVLQYIFLGYIRVNIRPGGIHLDVLTSAFINTGAKNESSSFNIVSLFPHANVNIVE